MKYVAQCFCLCTLVEMVLQLHLNERRGLELGDKTLITQSEANSGKTYDLESNIRQAYLEIRTLLISRVY